MKLIVRYLLLLLCFVSFSAIAQDDEDEDTWDEPERKGFTLGLNIGAYFGNKKAANFYNGTGLYAINDVQANVYTIEERLALGTTAQTVQNLLDAQSFYVPFDAYPLNMRYNPGIMIGFKLGYRFKNEASLFVDANYASLKAADKFTLVTNLLPDPSQGTTDTRLYNIIGAEDRLCVNFGYKGGVVVNETANWTVELGGSMLATRMVDNYVEIEGQQFDLWVNFIGPNNFNGPASNLTSTGYGWFFGTGFEMFFNETYEIGLGVRFMRDNVKLGTYEEKLMNKSFFLSFTI
ncbi:MAG: hypothetical protein GC193_13770 [Cryomorphaceae bacterium]|nr:hypothetical protein [Cryomorphaceae bacterium]